jgi:hypothetical protein
MATCMTFQITLAEHLYTKGSSFLHYHPGKCSLIMGCSLSVLAMPARSLLGVECDGGGHTVLGVSMAILRDLVPLQNMHTALFGAVRFNSTPGPLLTPSFWSGTHSRSAKIIRHIKKVFSLLPSPWHLCVSTPPLPSCQCQGLPHSNYWIVYKSAQSAYLCLCLDETRLRCQKRPPPPSPHSLQCVGYPSQPQPALVVHGANYRQTNRRDRDSEAYTDGIARTFLSW